jgi:chemotaxis protein methyltransferase CheR
MPVSEGAACRPLKASEFAKIRRLAYDTFGLDLHAGKETLVSARLSKQMREWDCRSFDEYYRRVVEDSTGESLISLIDSLTTNHTSFFREPAHFDFLRNSFLPAWVGKGNLNIWSAACSTGEEPYSIAMCLSEGMGPEALSKVHILATDISTRVLSTAGLGIYPAERFAGVSKAQLRTYWLRGERDYAGSYRAKKQLRALVEFERTNLLEPNAQTRRFSLIFCRNVMIYFDKRTQQTVINRLVGSLEPGGYLFTGHAESLSGIEHGLRYVQPAVYRKTAAEGRIRW